MAFDYSVRFKAIDEITAKINKINSSIEEMKSKVVSTSSAINKSFANMDFEKQIRVRAKLAIRDINNLNKEMNNLSSSGKDLALKGRDALIGGASFLAPLKQTVTAYQDIARAQGEIGSLGINEAGIKSITKSAMDFSNVWAGTTTADFIRASYDIKSGIASLSDADVGKFTALAGLTASATKSTTEEMTKLFALGHGIFREQFKSDVDFGNKFSSAISTAVKAFRTDGSDLVTGLSTLGASASAMGVSLQEQLSVIGMSKGAFNSASEGATSYRAFLRGAVNAQKELGLSFVDSQGKLLPMADIMDKIKGKVKSVGLTMQDARVQQALTKAFGSDEATKMISALIGKTDELRSSEKMIFDNMKQGTKVTEEMAMAMQKGREFELMSQQIGNMSAMIGERLAPNIIQISRKIGEVTNKIKVWTEKNPELTKKIAEWALIIGGVLATLGILSVLIGVIGMAIGSLSVIFTAFKFVLIAVRYASILFNMALWANPLTWVVIGVVALIAVVATLIIYWKEITEWVGALWDKIVGFISSLNILSNILLAIKGIFSILVAPIKFVLDLLDSFLSKFEIYNKAKQAVVGYADKAKEAGAGAYNSAMEFMGMGDNKTQNTTPIDNVNKNHTVVDVKVTATGATVTDKKATSTGGRVNLNTGSTGV